jgi:DNA (cytosine-5)-methyltransferase 1
MKILNLYCGIGGNRKLWGDTHQVTAVEREQEIADIYQDNFPNDTVIVTDAHQYLLEHIKEFDFIWSSPPCPTHSEIRKAYVYSGQNEVQYPDMQLYQEIILLKYFAKKTANWIVENVKPYYDSLIKPSVVLNRHYFWCNFYVKKRTFKDSEMQIGITKVNETKFGFSLEGVKLKHRKDQILRNLVDPEIGLYLLQQSQKGIKPLFNFDY